MMYVKLIIRNLKRSIKEYSIYMMTLIIATMLMYAYNGVVYSSEILELSANMKMLQTITIILSIVIVFILGWLIYYISNFILQKRSQEFGMYLLLGMSRKQVSRMFLLEQICLGFVAFFIGCFLGIFASQIMQAIIMQLFNANYTFTLSFSIQGFLLTLGYFFIIYFVELLRERKALRKTKIYDMLYIAKQNEVIGVTKKLYLFYFLAGIVSMCVGMYLVRSFLIDMATNALNVATVTFLIGVFLIAASIYLLFFGLSAILMKIINKRKRFKYKNNTMYLSSQIAGRLKTNRIVLASLSMLSLCTILFVCIGFKFAEVSEVSIESYIPYDIIARGNTSLKTDVVTDYLTKNEIGYRDHKYELYAIDKDSNLLMEALKGSSGYFSGNVTEYMKYEDYESLMKLKGKKALPLTADGYIILTSDQYKEILETFGKKQDVYGLTYEGIEIEEIGQSLESSFLVVVPDAFIKEKGKVSTYKYSVATDIPSSREWRNATVDKFYADNPRNGDMIQGLHYYVRAQWVEENTFSFMVINFCLLYFAIIFVCISATILATQQLSDARKQKYAYGMLWKMGLSKKEIHKLLRKQIAIYFFLPLVIPLVYLIPLSFMIDEMFKLTIASKPIYPYLGLSIIFFLFIYICYYGLAYYDSKRNIE